MRKSNKNTLLRQVSVLTLKNNGYSAKLMEAPRLEGDQVHALPPGKPLSAIPIHCLPGAPEGWVRGPGSYVVRVNKECGLWFDWRGGDDFNTAVVPTVKGMNPITGMQTENVFMQQYREKCPKHNIPFAHDLYCEECGYKWPGQNYVSSPNTLWWDGFRQADGSVRQFFFTEDDMRDVASAILGKENTVPAFGFAFYRCANDRRPKESPRSIGTISPGWYSPLSTPISWSSSSSGSSVSSSESSISTNSSSYETKRFKPLTPTVKRCTNYGTKCGAGPRLGEGLASLGGSSERIVGVTLGNRKGCAGVSADAGITAETYDAYYLDDAPVVDTNDDSPSRFSFCEEEEAVKERFIKDVSVGAGARIRQNLELDTTPLSEWGEKPESLITLYFVFEEQLEAIIEKGGIKELENKPEGYLQNVSVG